MDHLVVLVRRALRDLQQRPDMVEQVDGQLAPGGRVEPDGRGAGVVMGTSVLSMVTRNRWLMRCSRVARASTAAR